jgi:hypothetical protein
MDRISNEIRVNLSSSQILELLKFLDERLSNPNTLLPLKAILSAIKSHQIIEHVSSFIKTSFENNLNEKLQAKDPSEELFEIYFLAMELSDSLAITLYDAKVIKRAAKLCKKSVRLFPVHLSLKVLIAAAMYPTTEGGWRTDWEREQQGGKNHLQGFSKRPYGNIQSTCRRNAIIPCRWSFSCCCSSVD